MRNCKDNQNVGLLFNEAIDEINNSKNSFYIDKEHLTINPKLLKYITELEFYIIENNVNFEGSIINFPNDFKVVQSDLTHYINIEEYVFFEKDKHTKINLVEIYADSIYSSDSINDEIYILMKKIQKFLVLS